MSYTLGELAERIEGRLRGDPARPISGADTIRDVSRGEITFAEDPHLSRLLANSPAAAVVVPLGFEPVGIDFIAVADVHDAFAKIVRLFRRPMLRVDVGISPGAHVSRSARLAEGVQVHPTAVIGEDVAIGARSVIYPGVHLSCGCRLGEDVTVFPNAVLYENTIMGSRVLIHAGAVIGCYGFGYVTREGRHRLSAQLGAVTIGDDVEIGAGTTIDRGTYGTTSIGSGTKIDNQVQIGHNCRIGEHNLICAQVGIAGSCTTGNYSVMAGQVGLRDHVEIGHRAVLGAKSGVMTDVPDDEEYLGIPATPSRQQKILQVAVGKLPELRKELRQLVKRVQFLEQQLGREAA